MVYLSPDKVRFLLGSQRALYVLFYNFPDPLAFDPDRLTRPAKFVSPKEVVDQIEIRHVRTVGYSKGRRDVVDQHGETRVRNYHLSLIT